MAASRILSNTRDVCGVKKAPYFRYFAAGIFVASRVARRMPEDQKHLGISGSAPDLPRIQAAYTLWPFKAISF